MNELRQHKRSDKIKWAITFTAIILMAILIVGLCLQLFASDKYKPAEWFKKPEQDENTNAVISNGESNGIMLASARLLNSQYEENGISPQADSAYTLTATIEPDDAPDKSVMWSINWENANSTFASGKTVTNYVTVTPTSDGALTATVECKQAFGESVIITVISNEDNKISATCKIDYVKRVTAVTIGTDGVTSDFVLGQANNITHKVTYGVGTLTGEIEINSMILAMPERMAEDLGENVPEFTNLFQMSYSKTYSTTSAIVIPLDFFIPMGVGKDSVYGKKFHNRFLYGADNLSHGAGLYGFNMTLNYTYKYGGEVISSGVSASKGFYLSRGNLTNYAVVTSVSLDNSSLVF